MTQQVRKGYRNHRKATWAAVLVVLVMAVAAAPLATGGNAPKYYTLSPTPTAVCSSTTPTFTLALTNESRNNTVGSANITAPSYVNLANASAFVSPRGTADIDGRTIKLRGLGLATLSSVATVTISNAGVSAGSNEVWEAIVKQSNDFADAPGSGNLVTLKQGFVPPPLTVSGCHYAFVPPGPTDAVRNTAQTVRVQLQLDGSNAPAIGIGSLSLTAHQGADNDTVLAASVFTGLTVNAASGEWSFSVTGTVAGADYSLKTPDGTRSRPYFDIADAGCTPTANGSCEIGFTANADGDTGAQLSGTQVTTPILMSFASGLGPNLCADNWNWSPLTYTQNGIPGTFDALVMDTYTVDTRGYIRITHYVPNSLFVLTNPDNGNNIRICAGAKHMGAALNDGTPANAFGAADGIDPDSLPDKAVWDAGTSRYWGVLQRVSNCNKIPDVDGDGKLDPVFCSWGGVTIGGVSYRSATVLVPFDWDWKQQF